MRTQHLLREWRLFSISFIVGMVAANIAPAADLTLEVKQSAQQTLDISLLNQTNEKFFVLLGGLCKGAGAPSFRLVLRREGQLDEPLVLTYNPSREALTCGNPDLWIVFLPSRSRYGLTFLLTEIRFMHHMQKSLADITGPYNLEITYDLNLKQESALLASHGQIPDNRWWQGHLAAVLPHH